MTKYSNLLKNFIIFGLGNAGSKIVSLILVPIYTHYLTTSEYGSIDIITISTQILLPIVTLSIYESVLRFAKIGKDNNIKLLIQSFLVVHLLFGLFWLITLIFSDFLIFEINFNIVLILLYVQIVYQILSQYTRGIGNTKRFAVAGVLNSLFTGLISVLLLVFKNYGVTGYFAALIISYIISIIYLLIFLSNNIKDEFTLKLDRNILRPMLLYSIPMIPNSIIWWFISSSSRLFINFYHGSTANGLYAVSTKIPSLINLVSLVFTQAYQLSAFEEYDNNEKSNFTSSLFSAYSSILFISGSLILVFLRDTFRILMSEQYFDAWQAVPYLILGTIFSALSSFLGVAYTSAKQTKGVFTTSLIGGGVSLVSNWVLIPKFGIIGASFSSLISFLVVFFIRMYDAKKLIRITYNYLQLFFSLLIILLQTMNVFYTEDNVSWVVNIILFILMILVNKQILAYIKIFLFKLIGKIIE